MWDVSNVDTSKPGEYTVTGTVDTIGANKNHWKWTNAAGESKTDEDDLINSGANANNNWKQTGGFVDNETANKNRTLYSSTAITVTAKVTVTGETEPTDPDLLADFTFDDGDKTFDGGNATGATQGTATLADSKDGKAAKLSKNFWLNVTAKNGDALLKGKNDVTISYDVKPDVSGNTGWTFFAASNATKQEYGQEHYVGVLDKTTGITVERYNNNDGKRDSSGNVSYTKTNADWKHVDIVISGATAKLYIDSKLVAVNNNGQKLTDILGADGGVLQIGKANWSNGEYFSGLLDNLKIWGKALRRRAWRGKREDRLRRRARHPGANHRRPAEHCAGQDGYLVRDRRRCEARSRRRQGHAAEVRREGRKGQAHRHHRRRG